jgi:hypothetical protein
VLDGPAYIPPSIDATVVRDSEQPWREREAIIELIELSIGLEQSLLNDILAV